MAKDIEPIGSQEDQKIWTQVKRHYDLAKEDLDIRIAGFDKMDILFRSHIDEKKWPYRSLIFDPVVFTTLFDKTARQFANKPTGRMVPREGGDSLGAKINNELLMFQWDDNERVDGMVMLAKWALMDLTARKYGASFGLAKWHYQRSIKDKKSVTFFDGPNFRVLNNRDCLMNPTYSTVKNWFQHRDYVTLQEMADVNDAARTEPVYRNLDILRQKLKDEAAKKGGDTRESNYISKNKSIKGLTDFMGRDEVFKTLEVVTEYRNDRWITFSPKHGVVLRDIPNPYDHGQIPIVQLKYTPIDDDGYGMSDIEPIEKMQRLLNAYLSQNIDTLNMSTYTPLKVRSTGGAVQMHTLEFGPGKKWLMSDPATDVIPFESNPQGVAELVPVYRLIKSAMQEAMGESNSGASSMEPGSDDKTATEIKDSAMGRSARDSFNQLFLGEAIKKQMMFWFKMNQQFLFSGKTEQQKVIRIVGKDAISYFQEAGLDAEAMSDENMELMSDPAFAQMNVRQEDLLEPLYPVQSPDGAIPKMVMEEDGQTASLIIEPDDLSGNYDFIPDVQSMRIPDEQSLMQADARLIELALNPATAQMLMQDGYKLKFKELLEDSFERLGKKDADKYFEKLQVDPMQNGQGQIDPTTGQPITPGAGASLGGPQAMGNGGVGGIPAGIQTVPNGQAQPVVPGSF